MKILVSIKRLADANQGSGQPMNVELAEVKMVMNPFDEIALEEAIHLMESDKAEEVPIVSVGPQQPQETLRTALAMARDRAILVNADEKTEPLGLAKVLKGVVEAERPSLVILGKQAIDDDSSQTGQIVAALLGWAQSTFASKVELAGAGTLRSRRRLARAPAGSARGRTQKLSAAVRPRDQC
ncbi:electron transfer flavoprotein beta subunit [Bradyrhizobium sp. Gha]|nr:electron transfer flavoprotein beta subunit [Bradyrhizobium sp. Gha]